GLVDQRLQQGVRAIAEEQPLGQHARRARLGQDAQALGEEQPFGAAVLLVAKAARLLDERIGESGDLPGHSLPLPVIASEAKMRRSLCPPGMAAACGAGRTCASSMPPRPGWIAASRRSSQ